MPSLRKKENSPTESRKRIQFSSTANFAPDDVASTDTMASGGFAGLRPSSWSIRHIHILVKRYLSWERKDPEPSSFPTVIFGVFFARTGRFPSKGMEKRFKTRISPI
jgi:hypothetical protein